jgi:cytochrome c-type biogenesis protein CcmH
LRIVATLLALLTLMLWPIGVGAAPGDDAVRRVSLQLQCPVCEGQSVADSSAGLARDMRSVIRSKQAAGEDDRQILDEFVAAYGDGILADPPKRGIGLGAWFGPVLAVGLGTIGLVGLTRRWRRAYAAPSHAQAPADAVVVSELQRFREELGR